MTDYVTIRVPKDAHEEAKAAKEEAGQTWAEYLTDDARGADPESVATELTAKLNVDADEAMEEIEEVKAAVEEMHEEMPERKTTRNDASSTRINESQLAEALADYLINGENLPERIAGELR